MGSKGRSTVGVLSKYLIVILFFNHFITFAQDEIDFGGEPSGESDVPIDDFVFPLMVLIIFLMYFFLKRFKFVEKS